MHDGLQRGIFKVTWGEFNEIATPSPIEIQVNPSSSGRIPSGGVLTIPEKMTLILTVDLGQTLTNEGRIKILGNGKLSNRVTIENNGIIENRGILGNYGTIMNNGTIEISGDGSWEGPFAIPYP